MRQIMILAGRRPWRRATPLWPGAGRPPPGSHAPLSTYELSRKTPTPFMTIASRMTHPTAEMIHSTS